PLYPGCDGALAMDRAEELVRAACAAVTAIAWSKVMTKDVCSGNMVLFGQPADECYGSSSLRGCERVRFAANMFDTDGVLVRAHTMISAIAVAHHLINITVAVNDVMS